MPVGSAPEDLFFETYGLRILSAIRRITRAADIHSRRLNQEFSITSPQMLCLYRLARQGAMTLSSLAAAVNLSVSTVTGIADRLEAKGLTRRRRGVTDRRKVFIEVTELGQGLTLAAPSLLEARFSRGLRGLSEPEQALIARCLERVVALMEDGPPEALPGIVPETKTNEEQQ